MYMNFNTNVLLSAIIFKGIPEEILKLQLKKSHFSGIIITVDVDPI